MPISLSIGDIDGLRRASTTLLSPLEFASAEAWSEHAIADVMAVLRADKAYMAVPTADGMVTAVSGERTDEGRTAYFLYYWQVDHSLMRRRRERHLEVYHRDMLYEPGELARDELHNDWCAPHGLHDTLGMSIEVGTAATLPALLHVYHHRASAAPFGDQGIGLMRLLLPSFRCGVNAWRAMYGRRAAFAAAIDRLGLAIAMMNADGEIVHRTPELSLLLCSDAEAARVERAIWRVARDVLHMARGTSDRKATPAGATTGAHGAPHQSVVTTRARYVVRACVAERATAGAAMVVAAVERVDRRHLGAQRVAREFGLTPRESAVAELLAAGAPTTAIASVLGVARSTARHHVEHVMTKMGALSRAEAAARLGS